MCSMYRKVKLHHSITVLYGSLLLLNLVAEARQQITLLE